MHKNNAPTIDNLKLYQVVKSSKERNKTTILKPTEMFFNA